MKSQGKELDGSSSLFETHQLLQSVAGNDSRLMEFNLINNGQQKFVKLLQQTLFTLGNCCAISGTQSATMQEYLVHILQ
jgi:hypothetical protein